ncbi:hypothetical protein QQS21_000007 [Conoideocrella luteorostrata]|uniref:Flavin-containing monooxygenase n=1 Tax=Conoideocrella luteorostrata TaxID=1105319 RepID=A0AAJ0D205_9HYPO|nr:hypothetical protein QQS21_000007 [Conoideocrella luteorostrata]
MAPTVAVVGLGALGLVTLKNLLEEGFDAVGLERNDYIGGLWHFDEGDKISVLESTVSSDQNFPRNLANLVHIATCSNGSKQRGCFTDFPFPDETPDFPPAADVEKYLVAYAKHFDLYKHARLRTSLQSARWVEKTQKWCLTLINPGSSDAEPEYFDKVVFAMGTDQVPMRPKIPGIDKFQGFLKHSVDFKRQARLSSLMNIEEKKGRGEQKVTRMEG